MNTRLQQFLELENITPARLADILGVQRSGLSHILSGRNKPGYEFLTRLLSKFPHINSDWLLMGRGKPYRDPAIENSQPSTPPSYGNSGNRQNNKYDSIQYNNIRYNSVQGNNIPYPQIPYGEEPILWPDEGKNLEEGTIPTLPDTKEQSDTEKISAQNALSEPSENRVNGQNRADGGKKKRIKRVIIFYSDGSFEELFPHIG